MEDQDLPEPADFPGRMLALLGELDPDALVLNFVTVIEWMEPDGSGTFTTFNSRMTPWHVQGLMKYALDRMRDEDSVHAFMAHVADDDDE